MADGQNPQPDLDADQGVVELDTVTMPRALKQRIEMAPTRFDAEAAASELKHKIELAQKILPAILTTLMPHDFVIQGSHDDSVAYLQNVGTQRVKGLLGIIYPQGDPPEAKRVELQGGGYAYVVQGWIGSKTLGCVDFVVGGRSSVEKFFDKFDEEGNRLPVPELDVMKAAFTNWENRAISGLAGLRGITRQGLKDRKFPADKCRSISYGDGSKGGGGKGGAGSAPPKFGPEEDRGKPWPEVSRDGLRFYMNAAQRNLDDPEKKKWHDIERRRLEAIKAEIHRRQEVAAAEGDA